MAAPGIITIKTFSYRDAGEEWSNRYHFLGDPPAGPTEWRSLADDFIALEKTVLVTTTHIVRVLCYEDTDSDSVYSYDLAAFAGIVAGTFAIPGGDELMPGDVAYTCRWETARRTTTGKPIYLRKFWHGALQHVSDPDKVYGDLEAAVSSFGDDSMAPSGDWPGIAGPDGVGPDSSRAMDFLTTRTLKRRGRRP